MYPIESIEFFVTTSLCMARQNKENNSQSNGHAICVEKTLNDVKSSEHSIPFI